MRTTVFACLISLLAAVALAADRKFPMENGQTMSLSAGADWVVGDTIEGQPFNMISLHGADKTLWRLTLAPLPPHPTLTGDAGNLRIYVRNMARGIENTGATVGVEHMEMSGVQARGYYFRVKYTAKKGKQQIRLQGGDYAEGYTGALSIGQQPYLFEILWNKGGEAGGGAALMALRSVRIQ